jgi:hypothetical protein
MNQGNYTQTEIGNVTCGAEEFLVLGEIKNASFDR